MGLPLRHRGRARSDGFELTVCGGRCCWRRRNQGGLRYVLGVALGALLLLVIQNGLTLVRIDPLWLQGVYGLVIVAAVTIDTFVARRAAGTQR